MDKPRLNIACPTVMRVANTRRQIRTPNLSTKKPPKKGRMTLGAAYRVYRREKYVS
jgi:hypothetical protein